jgi:asparagine synthase (glutamine-hydrolyzing)
MCGFVGFTGDIEKNNITDYLERIKHRGPDQTKSIFLSKKWIFGFNRLSILDLSLSGAQPMQSQDKMVTIMHNGEIYNYRELRGKLESKGYNFASTGDTEVILNMYLEYGLDMLRELQGMYALAIWDERNQECILVRDPYGIKPLYYSNSGDNFAFSSEMKPLLSMDFVSREINKEAMAEFLAFEYIHAPNTIFKSIKKLCPGHYLKLSNTGIEIKEYYNLKNAILKNKTDAVLQRNKKEEGEIAVDIQEEVVSLLKESVKKHLQSDVPIGIFLSGGFDSGLLAALASEELEGINTYTLNFKNGEFDESILAKEVAEKYKTRHHEFQVKSDDFINLLPEILWYCDEPLGDSGILPNFIINKLVAQDGIKVVLSGAGGDELFAGYTYYFPNEKESLIIKHPVLASFLSRVFKVLKPDISEKINRALLYRDNPIKHLIQVQQGGNLEFIYRLLDIDIDLTKLKENYVIDFLEDGLNKQLYLDFMTYLPDDLMLLADRTTMAHSVEGRVPFLYGPLVEKCFSLPGTSKAKAGVRKALLKEIAKKYLPESFYNVPKRGFYSPIHKWSNGEFGNLVYKVLNSKRAESREVWNTSFYKKFVQEKRNYKLHFNKMYLMFILELYFRIHLDAQYKKATEISMEEIYAG